MDPRKRFSSRVDTYVKYRPGYPAGAYELMQREMRLNAASIVADIGSGTGIAARPLLERVNIVYCVEPNADMRAAAERWLAPFSGFRSIDGAGEHTGLRDASVDLVLCAQAFHWLDPRRASEEFRRICRPGGFVVLMWNATNAEASPFMAQFEALYLKHYPAHERSAASDAPSNPRDFNETFGDPFRFVRLRNEQRLDRDGLRGRAASSSHTPAPGQPGHAEFFAELDEMFRRHARDDGTVAFEYNTDIFWSQLTGR
jgi:SAM-dependent methyltransferase